MGKNVYIFHLVADNLQKIERLFIPIYLLTDSNHYVYKL